MVWFPSCPHSEEIGEISEFVMVPWEALGKKKREQFCKKLNAHSPLAVIQAAGISGEMLPLC